MTIIANLKMPESLDISALYLGIDGSFNDAYIDSQGIKIRRGSKVSLNTYFNSIYELYIVKYTCLENLFYQMIMDGDFRVSVYREKIGSKRILLESLDFFCCSTDKKEVIPVHLSQDVGKAGRIYLEFQCLSELGFIAGGTLETDQMPLRETRLAVITCTYKKENYVRKTVRSIVENELLSNEVLNVFVVDNARTLHKTDFPEQRVTLIENRNVGGSGGFTTGLLKALESEEKFSHFLFMDDDIILDGEVVFRLFALYSYSRQNHFSVAGSMLDGFRKHILYESGAKYGFRLREDSRFLMVSDPFSAAPLNHELYLVDPLNLNQLLQEEDFDYSGFWFFSFPREIVEVLGLPMPFFIKVDDMEYGVRIKKDQGFDIVAFPSIAVWHTPFYAKPVKWDVYYYSRNQLICNAVHRNYSGLFSAFRLTRMFLSRLFLLDYSSAEVLIESLRDFCRGPKDLIENLPEEKHAEILKLSRKYEDKVVLIELSDLGQFRASLRSHQSGLGRRFLALVSLLSLNGHLLPRFLLSKKNVAFIRLKSLEWTKVFGKDTLWIYDQEFGVFERKMFSGVGISLTITWMLTLIAFLLRWRHLRKMWQESFSELVSKSFWISYLSPVELVDHKEKPYTENHAENSEDK
jgi:galactofuranosylgalactofuranosylrhamnosyl-N-acetylglucosaminyl-diphospho-decaprenol beta-1,5/1,6-galactofuranosyltransferase